MPPHMPSVITLTTDFGTSDAYVAEMKGVILGINPRASIVDISHEVQPQSILEGAYLIGRSHRFFPEGTVHIVVVDPGVGTSRRGVIVTTPSAAFVAPDNGVLSHALREDCRRKATVSATHRASLPPGARAYRLTKRQYWLRPVSSTFHGRDIFAPVGAHLSLGVEAHSMGPEVRRLTWLPDHQPRWEGDALVGRVVHVDRFGNLITDIRADAFPAEKLATVEVKGHCIEGLSPSYTAGESLLAIAGSGGSIEVSVKNGSAAQRLNASVGDEVKVHGRPSRRRS